MTASWCVVGRVLLCCCCCVPSCWARDGSRVLVTPFRRCVWAGERGRGGDKKKNGGKEKCLRWFPTHIISNRKSQHGHSRAAAWWRRHERRRCSYIRTRTYVGLLTHLRLVCEEGAIASKQAAAAAPAAADGSVVWECEKKIRGRQSWRKRRSRQAASLIHAATATQIWRADGRTYDSTIFTPACKS